MTEQGSRMMGHRWACGCVVRDERDGTRFYYCQAHDSTFPIPQPTSTNDS